MRTSPAPYKSKLPAAYAARTAMHVRKHGLEPHEVREMIRVQDNSCAICSTRFSATPHLDHCHRSGQVRAFLCRHCNQGLGFFRDDPERLEAAARYLREHAPDQAEVEAVVEEEILDEVFGED